jgi:sugar (pentulose or hexulose) kinase
MAEAVRCLDPQSIITGWDFSTGSVKCLAFDLNGQTVATVRLDTDQWIKSKSRELNLMMLEGQARASVREMAAKLRAIGRLPDWVAGGISATHHTAGRIDEHNNQVRRAICWNDQTLTRYHAAGLNRVGGQERVIEAIGGPWAVRYTLSHLVKDERSLKKEEWKRTARILPHGALAAGYLTGRFDVVSVSAAASTGMMDLRTNQWCPAMLEAIKSKAFRDLAASQLPRIVTDPSEPIGPLSDHLALETGIEASRRPLIFPTSDDQAAGLVGGGAVDAGQVAVILGNSAVVNSSSAELPKSGSLDAMKLNWGPYLWMRCYNNGAQFLDKVIGKRPNWANLENARDAAPAGCAGVMVLPFAFPEPSIGVERRTFQWFPEEPKDSQVRYRASLEAIAYLIALGVREHVNAGQQITDITVSGGIARSDLMCEILATVLGRPLKRLESSEGPALGAAVTALAAAEQHCRREKGIPEPFTVADAVRVLVRYAPSVQPNSEWREAYQAGLRQFEERLRESNRVDDQSHASN